MDNSITTLSRYAMQFRYEDMPAQAQHETKRRLIDTLGCVFGGFHSQPARIARALARRSVGHPSARILCTQEPSTPEQAAFANGVMQRYLDYNDVYFYKSTGHPSDPISALLAVADAERSSGKDVLTAVALSYEPYCNLSEVLPRELGWDMCLYGVLAGAVGCAKIMGLNEMQMGQAISLSLIPNLPMEQTRYGELSLWKGCASANAARNSVFAAQLAQLGLTGPDEAIEGRFGLFHKVGAYQWAPFGGQGGPFRITQTHMKYFPAVLHAQSPITAALQLHPQVKIDDIAGINVESYWVANRYLDREGPDWNPKTRETADHSIPYIIAAALIDGIVSEAIFDDRHLADPQLRGLLKKMTIKERSDYTAAYPDGCPCRIEIVTHSGERKSAVAQHFKGHAKNPLSDDEIEIKFRSMAEDLISRQQIDAILEKLWSCDKVKDIQEVLDLFVIKDPAAASS